MECPLWVRGELLPQMEEFKYLEVLFMSDGRLKWKIDGQTVALLSAPMATLYRCTVVKREVSVKTKLSIFCVPALVSTRTLSRNHKSFDISLGILLDAL